MDSNWIVFALVLVTNALLAVGLAMRLRRKYAAPGRNSMIWMLIMLAVWAFSYAMITISPSLEDKILWLKFENIGILTVPVFWFLFTIQYAQLDKWLNKFTGALLFVAPLITLVILFNPNWFHLFYSSVRPFTENGGPLIISRGPWYFVPLVLSYLLNLTGMGLLIWRFIQVRDIFRQQIYVLVGAVLFPLLVNVFYQFASRFIPDFFVSVDLTPLAFFITALLLSMGVFGLQLFDLIPIARYKVLEHIPEMVFVVDAGDRVVDANSVAQKTLGKTMDEIVGEDLIDVFHDWPELVNRFLAKHETHEEIRIPGDPPLTLEIIVSALYNRFKQLEGRIIVAHDITDRKWLEHDLTYANASLKKQLIEIEQLRLELQEQAIRDPLTNVYNRRFLADAMDRELSQAGRNETPASVVILDFDFFKQFNDTYGHRCGDFVLQYIADFLTERIRRGDVLCRYGGEEFVIFMPNAPLASAYERAEAWRSELANSFIEYEGLHLKTSFSAGVAGFPIHGSTSDIILNAADKALYQAKESGRNKVVLYGSQSLQQDQELEET
ncbi:MAG TPA: diguanylate cyclase [Anaerolineales bacterium]|nr:diguanylate cyclase [Anaerolineales bacterium]